MILSRLLSIVVCLSARVIAEQQAPFGVAAIERNQIDLSVTKLDDFEASVSQTKDKVGHGVFSEWSRKVKEEFLAALRDNTADDYIIVIGNEAGDLDSMVSALSYSWYLSEVEGKKAVAVLQTPESALHLRKENVDALMFSNMTSGHRDILTIDELPIKPIEIGHRIQGLVLVDHNIPENFWVTSKIRGILDHHVDQGLAPDASPRIIKFTASCTTIVAEYMLSKKAIPPTELVDLMLRAIALDSGGLQGSKSTDLDKLVAKKLYESSGWNGYEGNTFKKVMKHLSDTLSARKDELAGLNVRDLLRRDWKSGFIKSQSARHPYISVGFASTPISLNDQIKRTPEHTPPEYFAIERAWTSEINADITIILNNFKNEKGVKTREIVLVVASGRFKRLHPAAAQSLFQAISEALNDKLSLKEWNRPDGEKLLARRAVWTHHTKGAGRKFIRPLVEKAVKNWKGLPKDSRFDL